MTKNDIYLSLSNKKQIKWWNHLCGRLVRISHIETIMNTDTKEPIGYLIWLHKGLFNNYVIKKINGFWK